VLLRGGDFGIGAGAGVFDVVADFDPSHSDRFSGFRCAR
jgi:hypothetical protein